MKKRVTVFVNGQQQNGKVLLVPRKWNEFVEIACSKLRLTPLATRIFNHLGGELDNDLELIQNNDVLYFSNNGADFIVPGGQPQRASGKATVDVARAVTVNELGGFVLDDDDNNSSSLRLSGVARCTTAPTSPIQSPKRLSLVVASQVVEEMLDGELDKTSSTSAAAAAAAAASTAGAAASSTAVADSPIAPSTDPAPAVPDAVPASPDNTAAEIEGALRKSMRRNKRHVRRPVVVSQDSWVNLNVGGRVFCTTRGTLTAAGDNMLAHMFGSNWQSATDAAGAYLIDRSPEYFVPLLNYLRCGRLNLDAGVSPINVLEEARFYGIQSVVPELERLARVASSDATSLTRKELITVLLSATANTRLRARGLNFEGADLSNLDLSGMNLARAKLAGANLTHALLDGVSLQEADLRNCNMAGASLRGTNLGGANLENAIMQGVNLGDNGGVRANLESANLKGTNLEDAVLSGSNARCCNFKGSNLANADLGRSDLAGANLEGANLRGANLGKANMLGANLKLAAFDHRTGLQR